MRFKQILLVSFCGLSLILAILFVSISSYNKSIEKNISEKQTEINALNAEISRGLTSKQIAESVIQDLLSVAPNKPQIQTLLSRVGITFTPKENPAP